MGHADIRNEYNGERHARTNLLDNFWLCIFAVPGGRRIMETINLETRAIGAVSSLAPWLATFPTAWAVGTEIHLRLGWHPVPAAITGLALETLGVAAAATLLQLSAWNGSKKASQEQAPTWAAVAAFGIYFASAVVLSAVIGGKWELALFPFLSLAATLTLGLRLDQARRETSAKEATLEAKAERRAAREAALESKAERLVSVAPVAVNAEPAEVNAPPVVASEPSFVCPRCGKAHENRFQLSGHMGGHTREDKQLPWN
jgi:hypothetical protein